MQVLITRPEPDALKLAETVGAHGHTPLLAPMLEVKITDIQPPQNIGSATLLFTSANGARAAAANGIQTSMGVFAVGEATAAAAKAAGYEVAGVSGGDSVSLAQLIIAQVPLQTELVHVGGSAIAGGLVGQLTAVGFNVVRWAAYEACAVTCLQEPAVRFLGGAPGAALFYSARTATIFAHLAQDEGFATSVMSHQAICLSPAVVEAFTQLNWRAVKVAAEPTQAALLNLLS